MSDYKKVELSTIAPAEKKKKSTRYDQTVRLNITLPESNEKSCPQFNYGDLLAQNLVSLLYNYFSLFNFCFMYLLHSLAY